MVLSNGDRHESLKRGRLDAAVSSLVARFGGRVGTCGSMCYGKPGGWDGGGRRNIGFQSDFTNWDDEEGVECSSLSAPGARDAYQQNGS